MRLKRFHGNWYLIGYEAFGPMTIKQCIVLALLDLDYLDYEDDLKAIFSDKPQILDFFGIGYPEI